MGKWILNMKRVSSGWFTRLSQLELVFVGIAEKSEFSGEQFHVDGDGFMVFVIDAEETFSSLWEV